MTTYTNNDCSSYAFFLLSVYVCILFPFPSSFLYYITQIMGRLTLQLLSKEENTQIMKLSEESIPHDLVMGSMTISQRWIQ